MDALRTSLLSACVKKNKIRKTKYELEVEQKRMEIEKLQMKLDNYDRNKQKLVENQKIDAELVGLKTQVETANADIRLYNTNIERLKNSTTVLNQKIGVNKDLISTIGSFTLPIQYILQICRI